MQFSNLKSRITFIPTFWPTLGTLIFLPLLISLGLWQWHRAEYKQHLLDHYSAQSGQKALSLEEALKDPEGFRYFAITVHGHYLNESQFLQDNQFYQHKVGYYVLTPFVTDSQKVILVNRGWVPKDLPQEKLLLGTEPQALKGRVSAPPIRTFHLGENLRGTSTWPRVIQVVKMDDVSSALGKRLEPLILLLNPEEPGGFARDWQPQGLSPAKHQGYALQWFAFAALLTGLYLVLNIRKS